MDERARCGIASHGVVCTPWSELSALRAEPRLAALATHLRMVDDQTVLATAAVLRAIDAAGWQERSFHDWGVIAGPRYLGRTRVAFTCARYRKHNIRGFSPLVVPHQSLHAVAGTLSIALKIHGPNFGIGGGLDHVGESLLTGLGMVHRGTAPGLWVVVTDFDPEPTPTATGDTLTPTVGHAVALALTPTDADAGLNLVLQTQDLVNGSAPLRVSELADVLQAGGNDSWSGAIDGVGRLMICPRASQALRSPHAA